ncbi:MAG: hypothetical protein KatS3mg119_1839 [Rhodothalassiaceae bacterium]|nr:MAG: hypothetical protein KatS3mg119_1839 [Rhodothalassiaceae bacterium]
MAGQTTRRGRLPLKLPEIDWADIEAKNDPFDPALDIFGLKDFAEGLKDIVEGVELPFTILLDGRWGTGKTVFIKQWVVMMRKAGARVVYFDAFRHDYHEDAFAALAGAILREFEKAGLKEQKPKIWEAFRKQAADLAIALGFGTLKGLAGLFTAGVAAAVLEEGEETARERYERSLAARVDAAFTLESQLEAFRKALSEAAAATLPDSKSEGANDKATAGEPYLIVVIDELDRCRPDFALKILELVKHVFQTDSLCFIISADTRNLGEIIRTKYGNDFDSMDYLKKFYDLYIRFAKIYVPNYYGQTGIINPKRNSKFNIENQAILTMMETFSQIQRVYDLSLRDLQRLYASSIVFYFIDPKNNDANQSIIRGIIGGPAEGYRPGRQHALLSFLLLHHGKSFIEEISDLNKKRNREHIYIIVDNYRNEVTSFRTFKVIMKINLQTTRLENRDTPDSQIRLLSEKLTLNDFKQVASLWESVEHFRLEFPENS